MATSILQISISQIVNCDIMVGFSQIWSHLIEIGPVVTGIQEVENGDLVVPVSSTIVCHMSFLTTDTQPCVLILF